VAKARQTRNTKGELERLRARLAEADETLSAIRSGEVDAIAVDGPRGRQLFTLQSADQPYRLLAERMNEGAASMTAEGTILFCNQRLAKMVGVPAERLVGTSFLSLLSNGSLQELLGRALQNDTREESHLRRNDGILLPVQLSLSAVPLAEGGQGVCAVITDISEQKRGEQQLRERVALLDLAHDAVIFRALDGRILFWNRGAKDLYGWSADQAVGKVSHELLQTVLPEPMERIVAVIEETREWEGELGHTSREGKALVVTSRWSLLRDERGKPTAILEINRDISDRKQAEEAARKASHYARRLIEASLDPLVTISPEGKITDVNKATENITGISRERLAGTDFSDYFTEPEKAREGYKKVFAESAVHDYPLTLRSASGVVTDVLYNASVFRNDAGEIEGVFAAARDVTERKQAEQKLREQAALLDLAHDAILVRGLGGQILFWSRGAADLYGWSAEEILGKVAHTLLRTEFPISLEDLQTSIQETREWEGELKHVCRNGSKIVVASRWSLLRDERGKPVAIMEINRDITEQKQANEALRQASLYTRSLIEASLDPLVTISRTGKITDVNEATEKATGIVRERLIGTDFSTYFTQPEMARRGYRRVFADGSVTDYPLALRHVSGKLTDVLYNASVFKNEAAEVEGVFAAARDVTERKRAEEEVRRLNEGLEQRVAARTEELSVVNKELEAFNYAVAHDLRAPLRHIHGFAEMLAEEARPVLTDSCKHQLDTILDSVQHMSQLLEDLLKLSRLGRQELRKQVCNTNSLIAETVKVLEPESKGREVEWRIADLPPVECDPTLFKQVLVNLLSNALKFTRTRHPAVIEIGQTTIDGEDVIFIRDNGVGYNMKYADKLFGLFQRLHRQQDFEGTGVGLAIVQRIMHRHGGRVWAEAEPDKGATFYVSLHRGEAGKKELAATHAVI
jgi:PAS domain S-box-containing protein